jgi:Ribbon-helix-helix protein, copG family.
MKIVTVHLPEAYLEAIDELVRMKVYPNRAEVIRMAVRDLIQREYPIVASLLKNNGERR